MTDFLESVRPVRPLSLMGPVRPDEAVAPSVRQLLAELAHCEDVVRAAASPVDDPEVLAALAREQDIIDELHRRNP
ncbi:MAG: hypothetical protein WB473_15575 [Pedococcus sp.]